MKKDINKVYQKLSHREHVLKRPERYLGATKPRTEHTWTIVDGEVVWGEYTYRPALLKMFDEIITNSVDFSKTDDGRHLNKIEVSLCPLSGSISVRDNGGIPVVKHAEYGGWLPDMLFGEMFSSSNYNEDDEELANLDSAGQNGEGASLVNVFATLFAVDTCDGKKRFNRTWRDNSMTKEKESVKTSKSKGTTITYIPDLSRFPEGNSHHDHLMLTRRVYEIAACNPHIKVSINDKVIDSGFQPLAKMLGCGVTIEQGNWRVGLFQGNGFHASYVNSVNTRIGGAHIDHVLDKIVAAARPKLKRKYKKDYKPSIVKGAIGLFLVCDINLPRFTGQTKEEMTTSVSEFGSKWEPTQKFLDTAAKLIVDWFAVMHNELASIEELKKLEEAQKQTETVKFYQIPKYSRATSKDRSGCTLFLTEGDSAAKPLGAAADRKIHGIYPLRGKILNVLNASSEQLTSNNEIKDIITILGGLKYSGSFEPDNLKYSRVVLAMDADVDGIHIRGLVALAFMTLWPDFIRQGRLQYLQTPVVVAYKGKTRHEFFTESDYELAAGNTKFSRVKYLKGLGSNSTEDFRRYISDSEYVKTYVLDDNAALEMAKAFDTKRVDDRKELFSGVKY